MNVRMTPRDGSDIKVKSGYSSQTLSLLRFALLRGLSTVDLFVTSCQLSLKYKF